jgi:hypothetical protein
MGKKMPHPVRDGAEDQRLSLSRKPLRLSLPIPERFNQLGFHAIPGSLPEIRIRFIASAIEEFIEPRIYIGHVALDASARLVMI